jgi:putative flippase GtrA
MRVRLTLRMTHAAQDAAAVAPALPMGGMEIVRYFAVSLVALGVDFACLLAFVEAGLHYLAANALAFALGAVAAYVGSVRWAFSRRRLSDRGLEFALFAGIGVAGLLVNELVLWAGVAVATSSLTVAKLGAAAASFLFNYGMRRAILFR